MNYELGYKKWDLINLKDAFLRCERLDSWNAAKQKYLDKLEEKLTLFVVNNSEKVVRTRVAPKDINENARQALQLSTNNRGEVFCSVREDKNDYYFYNGEQLTGFLLGYGKDSNDFYSGGSGTDYSNYLGSYASWIRDDGVYFDLIGKYNWFRHSFGTPLIGGGSDSGSYNNQGLSLSAEAGKRFQRGNGYFVEPAVELIGLWSTPVSYATANGLSVDVPSTNSLLLRLGCTAGRKWRGGDGVNREIYGKVGWVNEYAGDSKINVDSVSFDSSLKGHQWLTGVGYVEDTGRYQIYVDAEKSWGDTTSKVWGLNAGYRWKF